MLNSRERFVSCLTFSKVDRIPFMPGWPLAEALNRWYGEGLPSGTVVDDYFGFDPWIQFGGNLADTIDFGPIPRFTPEGKGHRALSGSLTAHPAWIVSENERTMTVIDEWGITQRIMKDALSRMPQFLDFPVKKAEDWEKMKKRFNPHDPRRYGGRWTDDYIKYLSTVDLPVKMNLPGFFWKGREFMGIEHFLKAFFTQPELVEDMMRFWCDFLIEASEEAVEECQIDLVSIWEDMAYKSGPHLSPKMIEKYILPHWKKVLSFLKKNGVKMVFCETDGNINRLIPLWLEAGFDGSMPIEAAADNDVVDIRKKYGRKFALIGNIDKRVLLYGREEIDRELEAKMPLAEEGGFIPQIDHEVPSVPFENFEYYVQRLREYIFS